MLKVRLTYNLLSNYTPFPPMDDQECWPMSEVERKWNEGTEDVEWVELIPKIPEPVRQGN